MAAFYFCSSAVLVALGILCAVCVLVQASAFALGLFRYDTIKSQIAGNATEALVLAQTLLLAMLITRVTVNTSSGYAAATGFIASRYIVFSILAAASLVEMVLKCGDMPIPTVLAAFITLPVCESALRGRFPLIYMAAVLFWLIRAALLIQARRRTLRESGSALSVKEGIDALQTGILFCMEDGGIVLVNHKMQNLVQCITGKRFRNATTLRSTLKQEAYNPTSRCEASDSGLLFTLPDETTWLFSENSIAMGGRDYIQISASDVTEQWRLTATLQANRTLLEQQSDSLKHSFANLKTVCHMRGTMQVRMRVHDVLGQRITVLLHALREHQQPDVTLLNTFAEDLPQSLKQSAAQSVVDSLASLQDMMAGIGVALDVQGSLPENEKLSACFFDVVMEATTNAVRHGFASEIYIRCERCDSGYILMITDNGIPPRHLSDEGGGIRGMRTRLAALGGTLEVSLCPGFTVTAILP